MAGLRCDRRRRQSLCFSIASSTLIEKFTGTPSEEPARRPSPVLVSSGATKGFDD
jgi:hypothetical protein